MFVQFQQSGAGSPADRAAGNAPSRPSVRVLNPLGASAWDALVARLGGAMPFHSAAWVRVLHDTYGHQPCYPCVFEADRLVACLPLVEVRSPLTGRRGVCLPFSDFCPPLFGTGLDATRLWEAAREMARERRWRYLEVRSGDVVPPATPPSVEYVGHVLELKNGVAALEAGLDSSVRRALRKAKASGLRVEISRDPAAVAEYYRLHCLTRRRHGVPPQPFGFFENIARHMLGADRGVVITARYQERAVAAAVFLHFGKRAIYKFGASDAVARALRANNLVMWEGIRYYLEREFESLHLGRTSAANEGLRRFKRGFGAIEQPLPCYRYEPGKDRFVPMADRAQTALNTLFRLLPPALLRLAGRFLYPHLS